MLSYIQYIYIYFHDDDSIYRKGERNRITLALTASVIDENAVRYHAPSFLNIVLRTQK